MKRALLLAFPQATVYIAPHGTVFPAIGSRPSRAWKMIGKKMNASMLEKIRNHTVTMRIELGVSLSPQPRCAFSLMIRSRKSQAQFDKVAIRKHCILALPDFTAAVGSQYGKLIVRTPKQPKN
jgi:hypothetical protein